MDPLPPTSLSEQGENDFQKWGRKTAEIRHLPSRLTSEKRGNSFFRKMGKYYLLFTAKRCSALFKAKVYELIRLNISKTSSRVPLRMLSNDTSYDKNACCS